MTRWWRNSEILPKAARCISPLTVTMLRSRHGAISGRMCARRWLYAAFYCRDEIGLTPSQTFVDQGAEDIRYLFKLYPWEWMLRDEFARPLPSCTTRFIEPHGKPCCQTRGCCSAVGDGAGPSQPSARLFSGDPRCAELGDHYARKPLYSREGANVTLVDGASVSEGRDGHYGAEGFIEQALAPLPLFEKTFYPVVGAWIVGSTACGIGIREDNAPVTTNMSRFCRTPSSASAVPKRIAAPLRLG